MEGESYEYQSGFGNYFSTEAERGALPLGQNNPQQCPLGLYAEQISGTAFTVDHKNNLFTWMYRIRPGVCHSPFVETGRNEFVSGVNFQVNPNQLRWKPLNKLADGGSGGGVLEDGGGVTFIDGLRTMAAHGSPEGKDGLAVHMYACNSSMRERTGVAGEAMVNADGDFLIVPQSGSLIVHTELGVLKVEPNEIVVIPRGFRFAIDLEEGVGGEEGATASGYVLEVFKGHFELPALGAIGANGLAQKRDFLYPSACYEDMDGSWKLTHKYSGRLYESDLDHSPFDVVAWHGNYSPFKYDLRKFCVINSVSVDHLDPSIFTVLTCPSSDIGTATADFVIFPPRWMVAEHTFRPPYYHRNCMTEFMGMVWGKYDAKAGFMPGGASLHSCMTPHGPDKNTFDKASDPSQEQKPVYFDQGLAFMFECNAMLQVADWALTCDELDRDYASCWQGLPRLFTKP